MQPIAIVTTDDRSRVHLRGASPRQRFQVSQEGDRFILDPVKPEPSAPRAKLVREEGGLLVAVGRPVTHEEVRKLLEDWP